jgi:alanine dehydrogenase
MLVGIPKESWSEERRVALTPAGVHTLARLGHGVIVHAEAGIGCGFSPDAYRKAGATIAFSAEEIFARADLVVKVMPPTAQECAWLPEQKFLFSSLNLGVANPKVHEILKERRAIAIGLELIEDAEHNLPVLTAMSEIAGMLLPQIAGRFLDSMHGGRGIMLGRVPGIPAANVVIIGAGTVGATAARSFLGAGACVTVMDGDLRRLRQLDTAVSARADTVLATPYDIERHVTPADVVVGAVLIHGRRAPHVLAEDIVRRMKPGSVILDVSIDQGGCVETSRPTTLSDPVFNKHGVTHYCVPNIPSSVARTASRALNNVVLSFVEELAEGGMSALRENPTLRRGVYLVSGKCTHEGLAGLLDWEYTNPDSLVN